MCSLDSDPSCRHPGALDAAVGHEQQCDRDPTHKLSICLVVRLILPGR